MTTERTRRARWIAAFGKFWWEFLVGDTPEIFVGTVAIVGATSVLAHAHLMRDGLFVVAPVLAGAMLAASVARAGRAGTVHGKKGPEMSEKEAKPK